MVRGSQYPLTGLRKEAEKERKGKRRRDSESNREPLWCWKGGDDREENNCDGQIRRMGGGRNECTKRGGGVKNNKNISQNRGQITVSTWRRTVSPISMCVFPFSCGGVKDTSPLDNDNM